MLNIPALAITHFAGETQYTALCWLIEKTDGSVIRGTEHDEDLEVLPLGSPPTDLAGVYYAGANMTGSDKRATSDGAVDNSEVDGAIPHPQANVIDVTVADIEAGLFNDAPVTCFLVDWRNPDSWQIVVQYGYLGEITRDSDRKYKCELRGLKQNLQQQIVRTYSETCQVNVFGDHECKLDLAPLTITGSVINVTNAKRFDAALGTGSPALPDDFYNGGELTFLTGANAGYMRECKRADNDAVFGHMSLWERFPNDPAPGDVFELKPGCTRMKSRCQAYNNFVNFRGHGVLITGLDTLMKGAGL